MHYELEWEPDTEGWKPEFCTRIISSLWKPWEPRHRPQPSRAGEWHTLWEAPTRLGSERRATAHTSKRPTNLSDEWRVWGVPASSCSASTIRPDFSFSCYHGDGQTEQNSNRKINRVSCKNVVPCHFIIIVNQPSMFILIPQSDHRTCPPPPQKSIQKTQEL